jgi:hypothetical protein
METNVDFKLNHHELQEKIQQWKKNKLINPFTKRKIKLNSKTYNNIEKIYNDFKKYGIYKSNKKLTKIEYIIQSIFLKKNFYKSYNIKIKKYLYIITYLEFRTRELYLQYIHIPENFDYKIQTGQPFKDKRLFFYEMIKLNMFPDYISFLTMENNNFIDKNIISLQILYKSYHELLSEHSFEHKIIVSDKDVKYEIQYIEEEFEDTKQFFYQSLDKFFDNIPKYKNIKNIHNKLTINNLICDSCGKNTPKLICNCGINIYCNEKCKIKDFKNHYENCKYITNNSKILIQL